MRSTIALSAAIVAAFATLSAANHADSSRMAIRRHHAHSDARDLAQDAQDDDQDLEKRGSYSGMATFYYVNTGNQGACGGFLNPNDYTVALNEPMWGSLNTYSSWCNKKIVISNGVKSTTATIRDACPESAETCHYGSLDMSTGLFQFFADESIGTFPITWHLAGGGGGSYSGGGSDGGDDGAAAAAAAAKKKKAAAAAAAKASSLASVSSKSAASSRSSASVASKSRASVASVSSASHYSATKAAAASASASAAAVVKDKNANPNINNLKKISGSLKKVVNNANN